MEIEKLERRSLDTEIETNKEMQILNEKLALESYGNKETFFKVITDTEKLSKLKSMKMGHHEFLINRDLGYYPYFSVELRQRIKHKKIINCIVTGEGGLGKTYQGSDICRVLAPKTFDVDNIVFVYLEFLRNVLTTPRGTPVEFDEPSYAMSKMEWYKDVVKALVKTVESFRFKGKPLFIPIINKNLLEKNIRSYLIQFHIVMHDRGDATAYRVFTSQFQDKQYNYEICELKYDLFDNNLCNRESCLDCKKLMPRDISKRCNIFRARYERKKANVQDSRYKDDLEEAKSKDSDKMNIDEIEQVALNYFDKFYDKDKDRIDVELMTVILFREEGIRIGHNKKYRLAKQIEYDHPKLFHEKPIINKDVAEKL